MLMYAESGLGYALGPNGFAEAGYGSSGAAGSGGDSDAYRDFDLFRPAAQSFPSTPAEVAAAGLAGAVQAGWNFQEANGLTFADFSGNGLTLTTTVGMIAGQRAVGLFDGAGFANQRAFESPIQGGNNAELALAGSLDKDWTTAWSMLVVFRCPGIGAAGGFINKSGAVAGAGWLVYISPSDGSLVAQIKDAAGAHTISTVGPGNHCDGAWHWAYIRWDPITDFLRVDTDLSTGNLQSTASIGNSSNAVKFNIGVSAGFTNATQFQIRSLIVFSDVATTVASIQAWWQHANTPAGMTFSRVSSLGAVVADDATGEVFSTFKTGQIPYEYNPLITTNPLKIGMPADLPATNLIPNSDLTDLVNWVGATANNENDSPRGFREGVRHTKAAVGDKMLAIAGNGGAVTAATTYTASVWCLWNGVSTAPELRMYRADGTTLIGTTSATDSSNKWRRLSLTFVAPATEAVRLSVSGAAAATAVGSAWFAMPQINTEDYAKSWILTKGATASTTAQADYYTMPGLASDFGTVKAWFTCRSSAAFTKSIVQVAQTPASVVNERLLYTTAGVVFTYDGATQSNIGAADIKTTESVCVATWDRLRRYGFTKRTKRNGVVGTDDNTNLPALTATPIVEIGCRQGAEQLCGIVSKVRVWKTVELAA